MNYILVKSNVRPEVYLLQGDISTWLEQLHEEFWLDETGHLFSLQPEHHKPGEDISLSRDIPSTLLRWEHTLSPDAPIEQLIQAVDTKLFELSPELRTAEIQRVVKMLERMLPTGT